MGTPESCLDSPFVRLVFGSLEAGVGILRRGPKGGGDV